MFPWHGRPAGDAFLHDSTEDEQERMDRRPVSHVGEQFMGWKPILRSGIVEPPLSPALRWSGSGTVEEANLSVIDTGGQQGYDHCITP